MSFTRGAIGHLLRFRLFSPAEFFSQGASGMKITARGDIFRIGNLSGYGFQPFSPLFGIGNRIEEHPGVGMPGIIKKLAS